MKQFNLDEFKKNLSQKVVTRDGRSVRIVCTDAKNEFPIITLITNDDKEVLMDYNNNGKVSPDEITDLDLFFEPIKKEGWVNLFKDEELPFVNGDVYKSEKDAKEAAIDEPDFIASVKISWEE